MDTSVGHHCCVGQYGRTIITDSGSASLTLFRTFGTKLNGGTRKELRDVGSTNLELERRTTTPGVGADPER